jgi:signal peptidase I
MRRLGAATVRSSSTLWAPNLDQGRRRPDQLVCHDGLMGDGDAGGGGGLQRISRPTIRSVLSLFVIVVLIGVLSFSIRAYAVQDYVVPSGSMLPTLQIGDRIAVDKLSSTIRRGDIVVFNRAPGDHDPQYPVLVKRVIGLPGETISSDGNTILIDGKSLAQPWLPTLAGDCYQAAADIRPTTIPAGQYFVMGDCRGDSDDSRYWGTVPRGNIVGKVSAVIWRHNHPWVHWF